MKRDWKKINGQLVQRGEFFLVLDFLDSWDGDLRAMNHGKKGRPYLFPDSFIRFVAFLRVA